jgi:hypothetical protein
MPVMRVTFSFTFSSGFIVGVSSSGFSPSGMSISLAPCFHVLENSGIRASDSPGKKPLLTTPMGT